MRAIVIAAGMGKRMGKLTQSIPKCLLKFNDKSLLTWTIDGLEKAGCDDIWIITGYKSQEIEKLGYKTIKNKDYENNKDFYEDKIQTAKFYFKRVLPRAENHFKTASSGSDYIMNFKFN